MTSTVLILADNFLRVPFTNEFVKFGHAGDAGQRSKETGLERYPAPQLLPNFRECYVEMFMVVSTLNPNL